MASLTTWYVLASGPSLTPEDIDRVRFERESERATVVATNTTALHVPFADYCFAMDKSWLESYRRHFLNFGWEVVSTKKACQDYGARYVGPLAGNNSGQRAISFAVKSGANEVIVLGMDCKHVEGKAHHFGDHPPNLKNADKTENWITHAESLAESIDGVRLINCSPVSSIRGFEKMTLEQYLGY